MKPFPPTRVEGSNPSRTLSVLDAVIIILGVVIGAGIFKTPSLVAANAGSPWLVLLVWLVGGVISLLGALCYAELTSAYPHAGGDYFYLHRAFGRNLSFLFAWARLMVIQTGSIAMTAFLIGDYASAVLPLGAYSASWYAALVILFLTVINVTGLSRGKGIQKILLAALYLGLLFVAFAGFILIPSRPAVSWTPAPGSSIGLAMIFVLLTYGGWNEAAYLSAEVRQTRNSMLRVLLLSLGAITAIYLITNLSFLKSLGLPLMAQSEVVAADLLRGAWGENGARFISLLVGIAALGNINGMIITGARTTYALGRDFPLLGFLGHWEAKAETPVNALLAQGTIALALVGLGTGAKGGFVMMVEYTAPVFWFFFLLTGISLLVLRRKDPERHPAFQVPFYPWIPILFILVCLYLLYSSLMYTGTGALVGVGVLAAGLPLLFARRLRFR
ncbi:MAG: amino acid permease [Deltaproteobacteria bacterium]|nr:amino acid permease [Deltaproteobacteria bacterium]